MKYQHRFIVHAPIARVADFHSRASSMAAITPPPVVVRMRNTPAVLAEGDRMDFTMWLGPLPVRWVAQIEEVSPAGFQDRQLSGPFAHWVHRHSFTALDASTTAVTDEISLRLQPHLLWGPVGLGMRLGLPLLFAFRAWKTRRLLQ